MEKKQNYYFIWGIVLSAFGVFSTVAAIGIVTGYLIPPFWRPELWLVPLGFAVASAFCVIAALVFMFLSIRHKK